MKTKNTVLEKHKFIISEIALIIVLSFVLLAFEWNSTEASSNTLGAISLDQAVENDIINTFRKPEPPKKTEIKEPEIKEIELVIIDKKVDTKVNQFNTEITETTWVNPKIKVYIDNPDEKLEIIPWAIIEEKPVFEGGEKALLKYIAKNTNYPRQAVEYGIEGKVYIEFIISEQGFVEEVKIIRGADALLDEEAKRVIKTLPKWTPGKQQGKPCPVSFIIPIDFTLD